MRSSSKRCVTSNHKRFISIDIVLFFSKLPPPGCAGEYVTGPISLVLASTGRKQCTKPIRKYNAGTNLQFHFDAFSCENEPAVFAVSRPEPSPDSHAFAPPSFLLFFPLPLFLWVDRLIGSRLEFLSLSFAVHWHFCCHESFNTSRQLRKSRNKGSGCTLDARLEFK